MEREARGRRLSPLASLSSGEAPSGVAHLLPEPVLGLLHAPRCFGVTHPFADALESRETESGKSPLSL